MSAGGPGLFDDDLAGDVRDIYRRLLQDRVPDDEATRRVVDGWAHIASDEEPSSGWRWPPRSPRSGVLRRACARRRSR